MSCGYGELTYPLLCNVKSAENAVHVPYFQTQLTILLVHFNINKGKVNLTNFFQKLFILLQSIKPLRCLRRYLYVQTLPANSLPDRAAR